MHIESVDTKVICSQVDTLENFLQCKVLPVSEYNYLIWELFHLALDKAQQVFLVHASRMMHMCINLSNVIEVSMGHTLAVCHFLVLIQQHIKVEFALQILQTPECEALTGTIG